MYDTRKIVRDDGLELGMITQVPEKAKCPRAYQGSGQWLATNNNGGSKYFVHYHNALKWLEKKNKHLLPISRLAEFVNRI